MNYKLLFIHQAIFIVCFIGLINCSGTQEDSSDQESISMNEFSEIITGNGYHVNIRYSDGQENSKVAEVLVAKEIFENLDLTEQLVLTIINKSIIRAQYELSNPRTFRLAENRTPIYVSLNDDNSISVLTNAIGENSYGVEQDITILDEYDTDGEPISIMAM